ncbi:MAG TPA: sialidase family protein [Ktedonobacteraceae bacterium]|nr:sialidase family protein [Ktedonobacteraceae bacterium]
MIGISRFRWKKPAFLALTFSLLLTFSLVSLAFAAEPLTQISSDPYTNSTSNHKTQVEPDTFAFGNTIVSAFQSGRFFDGGGSNIGFATSTNGGSTWTHGFLPSSTVFATPAGIYGRASDASVAYDAKHKVWLISWLGIKDPSVGPVDVLVSRSTDGGLTFGAPVVVNASGDFNDKNWTTCDDTASSPFYGRCYTEFDDASNVNRVQMSTSTNGGVKWGAAKTTPDHTCVIGGQPLVQPNGTVIVPIDDCFETAILSFKSTDGGNTWSRPVLAAQILNDGHPGGIRAPTLPTAEIDKSGRVYVVWSDCRFEAACSAPIGTNDLLLISSADGTHWTLPKRIPADSVGSGVDHFIPGLAVDRSTSGRSAHLGLAYYYYANSNCTTSTCQLNVGFISSTNGGTSWSTAEQLAGPMTLTWLPLTTQGFMVADYISTSIVPGDNDATPVFQVAKAPTPPPSCSNLSTGAPGQGCDQATYTTPEDVLQITGGTNVANDVAPSNLIKKSGLSTPATAF